jgi:RHH-type rel operon transcriptional repressor/antitoxin RelB
MIGIRLPADIEGRLNKLAKATGRTKSYYVREALVGRLPELEAAYLEENRRIKLRTQTAATKKPQQQRQEAGR